METVVDDLVKYNEIEYDYDEQTDKWTYYLTLEQYRFWTEYWRHSREDDRAIGELSQWYDRDEMHKILIEEWGDEPYYT
ncbi:MAG: hypothetical protein LIO46_00280 [Clostridiales bacterium]|nr:hypothetical protein [Clostridiales bacterium]